MSSRPLRWVSEIRAASSFGLLSSSLLPVPPLCREQPTPLCLEAITHKWMNFMNVALLDSEYFVLSWPCVSRLVNLFLPLITSNSKPNYSRRCARDEGTWWSGRTAPLILNLYTRWIWVVSFTTCPLYSRDPAVSIDRPQSRCGHLVVKNHVLRLGTEPWFLGHLAFSLAIIPNEPFRCLHRVLKRINLIFGISICKPNWRLFFVTVLPELFYANTPIYLRNVYFFLH